MSTGLIDLASQPLAPALADMLDEALADPLGPTPWVKRKGVEARELCGLVQRAPRLELRALDLRTELRAHLTLDVPVPVRTQAGMTPVRGAQIGLVYPMHALRGALPGYAFVRVLRPRPVWHPNVHALGQELCLGVSLPAGLRVVELVLASYRALAMQTLQVDERDAAGVMNAEAALWWQQHLELAPLPTEGLLEEVAP